MHRSHLRLLHTALLSIPLSACVGAPASTPSERVLPGETARRIDALFAAFDRKDSPGYVVGIVENGALVYARGFGSANLDYGIPITPRTVFNVASLSKQFTAAALGLLVVEGRVSLTDEVRSRIAEFPERFGEVRIEHLIYMTSGIPEYYRQPRPCGRTWESDPFTVEEAIAASLAQPALEFRPGTRWAYSNVNYMLLAEIVERVSGEPFAEFARRRIFEPLGMRDSHFNDDLTRVVPNRAVGYNVREGGGFHQHARISPHYGGSGLFTTLEDLARWDLASSTHELGGEALTRLLSSTKRFDHEKANDAFGLVWGESHGHRTLWYAGGDLGFSSYMVRFPDLRRSVIVLSNLGTGAATEKAAAIVDLLLGG